jgi:DNA-binding NarL/FixJ family response regulator
MKKRILLVDPDTVVREGLCELISRESDLEICAHCGDGFAALELASMKDPDLVLTEMIVRAKFGTELIKDFGMAHPHLPLLILSARDEGMYAERALRAGARGYVMKREESRKVLSSIRHVLDGGIAVSSSISAQVLHHVAGVADASPFGQLTDRELEIFQFIGTGMDDGAIADALHLSPRTVETHRRHIKEKLAIPTTPQLIAMAARWTDHSVDCRACRTSSAG